ncbi:MAG: ZPR1 zinc finger domain-containing protein [archaeon]
MVDEIKGEICPFCNKKTLTLREEEVDVPHFGKTFVFSMECSECHFNKSDIEAAERKDPVKITFTIEKEEDLKIRVVKSSEAAVKIPGLKMDVRPGPASIGYISNIEGLLDKFQGIIESERDNADEEEIRKKAKNLLKKLRKVKWGEMPLKIIIEDPSGNSAIISERTEIKKLK